MTYEYKVVQIPPNIQVDKNEDIGQAAARFLEGKLNLHAGEGWEFYRIDSMGVVSNPGCLGILSGQKAINTVYHVVTFRKSA